jgi:hypothetical protein
VQEKKMRVKALKEFKKVLLTSMKQDFEECWDFVIYLRDEQGKNEFNYIKKRQAEKIWEDNKDLIARTQERQPIIQEQQTAIRKRKQEQLAFWVGFSRVFIKSTLNVCYALLFLGVCYGLYKAAWPTWIALCWVASAIASVFGFILSISVYDMVVSIANFGFRALVLGGLIYLSYRLLKKIPFSSLLRKSCLPFEVVGQMLCSFYVWTNNGIYNAKEFIRMFYEENCPAIIIVEDKE